MAGSKLTPVVEAYFTDLRLIRASGGVTNERSVYVPLANLLNAVGGALRPTWPTLTPPLTRLSTESLVRRGG